MFTERKVTAVPPNKGKAKPLSSNRSTQQGRSLRYDSADSSDSGVGVESAVWSPCSSLQSYSPPPLLSDPDDDLSEGGPPPPSPPQSEPPSPEGPNLKPITDDSPTNDRQGYPTTACSVTRMAPNDASATRVGGPRKGSPPLVDPEKRLMGICGFASQDTTTTTTHHLAPRIVGPLGPHKDRPPDSSLAVPAARTRRMTSSGASPRSPRKRGTDGPRVDPERRTKTLRGGCCGNTVESSENNNINSSVVNDIVKLNGQVTTEPALLARLAGLTGSEDPRGRCSPRTRCSGGGISPPGVGKDGGDRVTVNNRINGVRRQQHHHHHHHLKDLNITINNNISSRNKNIERGLLREFESLAAVPPPPPPPVAMLQDSSSSSGGGEINSGSLGPALLSSSRLSTSSTCSSSSGIGSSINSGDSSCCSNSSSAPTSGASTPTSKVRFPAPQKKDSGAGDTCRWRGCGIGMHENSSLLEHIQAVHVEGQLEAESFRCLWVGCKVYDRASCSVSWLERHVLTHGGHKPFKCIVDGCGQRFTSQNALERHVNHHFNSLSSAPAPKPSNQSSPTKLIRKNGRKFRYRKKPWSARIFDFFDLSTMEQVRWGLVRMSQAHQDKNSQNLRCDAINFTPKILARRKNIQGESETLVTWSPPGMLPDEWLTSKEEICRRSVPLSNLSHEGRLAAGDLCFPGEPHPRPHNSRKRASRKTVVPQASLFTMPLPPPPRPLSSEVAPL